MFAYKTTSGSVLGMPRLTGFTINRALKRHT